MLTKTLETLIERAKRNGTAVKRVREGAIMGGYGIRNPKETPMVEQWRVTVVIAEQDGNIYENIIVDHYGTGIAHIIRNLTQGTTRLHSWYGESNSDRDALNGLCSYYGIDAGFRYRPSKDLFEMA